MLQTDPYVLVFFIVLSAVSVAALAYGVLYTRFQKAKLASRRFEAIRSAESGRPFRQDNRERAVEAARRRKTVEDTLKDIDARQNTADQRNKPPLKTLLRQAGLQLTVRQFYLYSVLAGMLSSIVILLAGASLAVTAGAFVVATFGLPRWLVLHLRKRRVRAFLDELPNALDVIIRAVRSGLPINDGIRLIAVESREPVRSEFRRIVESQQIGLTLPEASLRMQETMPCAEAGFFGIVIQIQQQAGGNLSEALGNLSRVLRERKKMKGRIAALSMEARASAAIIGSLPVLVAVLIFFASPAYIMPLFTTSTGQMLLGGGAVWMGIGVLVMRQMMDFEI